MKELFSGLSWQQAWLQPGLHLGFQMLSGFLISLTSISIWLSGALLVEHFVPKARAPSPRQIRFNLHYAVAMLALVSALRPLILMLPLGLGRALGLGWLSFAPGPLGWLCAFVCVLVLTDFLEYAFHRAQHAWPLLWRMHELHHSAEHYDVTLCYRHFWIEPLIKMVFVYPLIGVIFDVPVSVATAVGLVFMINHHFAHMNLAWAPRRITLLFSYPQYHRLHHSRNRIDFDKNFCDLLPLWDILFQTMRRPAPGQFVEIGLDQGVGPTRLLEALVWPWRQTAVTRGPRLMDYFKARVRTVRGTRS
jgi:sterol desaturase/sphingolipid hydroxylase (fatty acid hydroxylase superfamily)